MFTDIADYTSIAERLTVDDLMFLLRLYFTHCFPIIAHFRGTVAEIHGDAILAYWNVPDEVDAHAARACAAAIALQQSLAALNRHLTEARLPKLVTRIGVHTGRVLTGNIGSAERIKFGCLGDAVNVASRLEGSGEGFKSKQIGF